jgi:putative SOS response-associated peptidase YedK
MCGRYLIEISDEELCEIVAEAEKNAPGQKAKFTFTFKGGEIFPGTLAPVMTANNKIRFMTWGFPNISANRSPHINVRSETAATSKTFGDAIKERRCIIPASAYYEWETHDKKHKTKYEFKLPDKSPLYMAGVYSADGRFAVLTREAEGAVFEIHDRMPVILPKTHIEMWFRGSLDVLNEALTNLQFVQVSTGTKLPKQASLFD